MTFPEFHRRVAVSCQISFLSEPVLRAIKVSHAPCKDDFRRNPSSHSSCRFISYQLPGIIYHDTCTSYAGSVAPSCRCSRARGGGALVQQEVGTAVVVPGTRFQVCMQHGQARRREYLVKETLGASSYQYSSIATATIRPVSLNRRSADFPTSSRLIGKVPRLRKVQNSSLGMNRERVGRCLLPSADNRDSSSAGSYAEDSHHSNDGEQKRAVLDIKGRGEECTINTSDRRISGGTTVGPPCATAIIRRLEKASVYYYGGP